MNSLHHEISIRARRSVVFDALTTVGGLQGWFSKGSVGSGTPVTAWEMTFPGSPTRFTWEIEATRPEEFVAWRCLEGPGDAPGTTVEFRLEEVDRGTRLQFTHRGWPHSAGNFVRCNTLWGGLLHHLAIFSESGIQTPLYS